MGCWGMGMTQSDEFCEIYNRFMEEYDKGEEICEIKKAILSEYLEQFEEKDGVLHDVYFAIAKAEWMCGALSEEMLARVKEIVEKGENLVFYKELGASDIFNETVMLGLRKVDGVDLSLLDPVLLREVRGDIARHCRLGNLVMEGDKIRIPHEHLFVSDGIIRDLFV